MTKLSWLGCLALGALAGANCGGSAGGGQGGAPSTGGAVGTGGSGGSLPGSGGRTGTGGAVSSGGASATGGLVSSGGAAGRDAALGGTGGGAGGTTTGTARGGSGGSTRATGGVPGTGGTTAGSGGATRTTGGATGSGGSPGSGGAIGSGGRTGAVDGGAPAGLWSMGYYASWEASKYPISEIEWSGLTHIAMSFYMPQQNGSLSLLGGNPDVAAALIAAAHAHGVKAVASIGGAESQTNFKQAMASGTVATFASNLTALVTTTGYDGIDIDWEPMDKADEPAVIDIAKRIRQAAPGALLTVPIGAINVNIPPDLSGFAAIAAAYDQLNIMSYGQAGAWQGWKSWHSSALYHTDSATPISIDSTVKLYLAVGVPAAKLGIGIGFYGLCYSPPVTGPAQALDGATLIASDGAISYANIMANYCSASARKWDDLAKVPYLSFTSAQPPDGCGYISYDDEQSIAEKGAYAKAKGLGGVIQWELNEAYLAGAPAGQRNPLLKAIAETILR